MGEGAGIVRFGERGPDGTGLATWETIDPTTLISGTPVQRGHIYDEEPATGYLVGVWDCTAFTTPVEPYSVDEFMLLLEGSIVMILPDGTEVEVGPGKAFVIPKGFACQWRQPGYVRKFFMILDRQEPATGDNASLSRITVPRLAAPPPAGGVGGGPVEHVETWFANADGRMSVVVRTRAAMTINEAPAAANALVHVLAGQVDLISGGERTSHAPGATFYVRKGTSVGWTLAEGTRTLEARYAPAG